MNTMQPTTPHPTVCHDEINVEKIGHQFQAVFSMWNPDRPLMKFRTTVAGKTEEHVRAKINTLLS